MSKKSKDKKVYIEDSSRLKKLFLGKVVNFMNIKNFMKVKKIK
jgi:hypothetical protein